MNEDVEGNIIKAKSVNSIIWPQISQGSLFTFIWLWREIYIDSLSEKGADSIFLALRI